MHTFTESEDTLKARGQYSTLKHVHDAARTEFVKLLTDLQSGLNSIVREATDSHVDITAVKSLLALAKSQLDSAEFLAEELSSLSFQRQQLHPIAWPK